MKIEHVAIWAKDLELMRSFYEVNFQAISGEKYENTLKQFTSYFLSFQEGCRLELMHNPKIAAHLRNGQATVGLVHFAISVGSREHVAILTEKLRRNGSTILGEPRTTGDGYYESIVLDPEGNQIEITI